MNKESDRRFKYIENKHLMKGDCCTVDSYTHGVITEIQKAE